MSLSKYEKCHIQIIDLLTQVSLVNQCMCLIITRANASKRSKNDKEILNEQYPDVTKKRWQTQKFFQLLKTSFES